VFPAAANRPNPNLCHCCHQPFLREDAPEADFCGRETCLTRRQIVRPELKQLQQDKQIKWLEVTKKRTRSLFEKRTDELAGDDAAKVTTGLSPRVDRPLSELPQERRASFETHLRTIVAESFEDTPHGGPLPPAPADDPDFDKRSDNEAPEPAALHAACIACRGECCIPGATQNAFLVKSTIDRFRWLHPQAGPKEVLDHYLSALPERSVAGSCVFHGEKGCTLERAYRSNICNNFLCWFRRQLDKDYAVSAKRGAVVIAIDRTHVRQAEAGASSARIVSVSEDNVITEITEVALPALSRADLQPYLEAEAKVCRLPTGDSTARPSTLG
jgi:hypothetical protein